MTQIQPTPQQRFEALIQVRGDDYEKQRLDLFADPEAVAYLPQRFEDPDRVTAFIAKQLHLWATQKRQEIVDLEEFIRVGMYKNKEKLDETAVGWQPNREISNYLGSKGDTSVSYEYLLLKVLMRPKDTRAEDSAISAYYSEYAVMQPEVWIRAALELNIAHGFNHMVKNSLRITEKSRTLRALNHERNRALRLKQPWPEQFENLRQELMKTTNQ